MAPDHPLKLVATGCGRAAHTHLVRRGHVYAVLTAAAIAVGVGFVVGDVNQACVRSCPAGGCPPSPACGPGFYWAHALVVGGLTFLISLTIALAAASAFRADR